jgi:hypothetical protein
MQLLNLSSHKISTIRLSHLNVLCPRMRDIEQTSISDGSVLFDVYSFDRMPCAGRTVALSPLLLYNIRLLQTLHNRSAVAIDNLCWKRFLLNLRRHAFDVTYQARVDIWYSMMIFDQIHTHFGV